MKTLLYILFLIAVSSAWTQGTSSIKDLMPGNHSVEISVFFSNQAGTWETEPFTLPLAVGPVLGDLNAPAPPNYTPGYYLGLEIYDKDGKIVSSSNRTICLDLAPGTYTIKCWSDSTEVEAPPDFVLEVKPSTTEDVELVFKSKTLRFDQIEQSLFEVS